MDRQCRHEPDCIQPGAGTYTITATDNKACTGTAAVTITQNTALTITMGARPMLIAMATLPAQRPLMQLRAEHRPIPIPGQAEEERILLLLV